MGGCQNFHFPRLISREGVVLQFIAARWQKNDVGIESSKVSGVLVSNFSAAAAAAASFAKFNMISDT